MTCFTLRPLFADKWEMIPLNPLATDEKTVAERKWRAGLKPSKDQKQCEANQFDLIENALTNEQEGK